MNLRRLTVTARVPLIVTLFMIAVSTFASERVLSRLIDTQTRQVQALADVYLSEADPDAVICDIRLPDRTGADVFRSMVRDRKAPPFLFITGYGEIDEAVRLMREGARDYLTKPFVMTEFLSRLEQVLGPAEPAGNPVLGVSPPMQEVERFLRRASRVTSSLLLTGETGVRELRNRVERAVALAAGRWIMPADLFPERSAAPVMENRFIASLGTAREDAEKRHIQRALAMMIVRSPLPEVVRLSEPRHPPCSEIRTRPLGVRPCQAVALHLLP